MKERNKRLWKNLKQHFGEATQLTAGGYETTRTIEAKTIRSAEKKANEICAKTLYGGMKLLYIEEA